MTPREQLWYISHWIYQKNSSMITFLTEYGLFLAKSITLVLCILVTMAGIVALSGKKKSKGTPKPQLKKLNHDYEQRKSEALAECDGKQARKAYRKQCKAKRKAENKQAHATRVFVLNFQGDIKAKSVTHLREEVTTILLMQQPGDKVIVNIESAGGLVHAYGLAAAQLDRLRQAGIHITATIDKIAASGGYLMASVADHIVAAPFAIVGSIGVVAQMPNFHRFLQQHNVDFEQITAGQYKRTLTVLGKNTDEGRAKFQKDVNQVHELFKNYLHERRPQLDLSQVATGEYWHAAQALPLGLIDALGTSDDLLLQAHAQSQLIRVQCPHKQSMMEKLSAQAKSHWQAWCFGESTPYHE